jgi:hypothetical protein
METILRLVGMRLRVRVPGTQGTGGGAFPLLPAVVRRMMGSESSLVAAPVGQVANGVTAAVRGAMQAFTSCPGSLPGCGGDA